MLSPFVEVMPITLGELWKTFMTIIVKITDSVTSTNDGGVQGCFEADPVADGSHKVKLGFSLFMVLGLILTASRPPEVMFDTLYRKVSLFMLT